MTRHRTPDTQSQIDRLEHRHSQLSARVADLDRHPFLSTQERLYVSELKKEKLAAKDAIFGLRRSS
jgi:hypothetical protein